MFFQSEWVSEVAQSCPTLCDSMDCSPPGSSVHGTLKARILEGEISCFFHDPADVGIWSLVPLPFLKPAWTSGSSWFTYCWRLAWRILRIPLLACEMSCNYPVVWTFFGTAFLWDWNENWPFPVLWPLLSLPNLLAYWVQHFHSIIFQDLK